MRLQKIIYGLAGRVWIPPVLRFSQEPVLLHLADTPSTFFPALGRLLDQLKPRWIVHTGDLVDDVKLGMNPAYLSDYAGRVRGLIRTLEASAAEEIWLCLGNHDDGGTIRGFADRCRLVETSALLELEGLRVGVAHYGADALATGAELCLFGHSLELRTDLQAMPRRLNGLEGIHVITPRSGAVTQLAYPTGTDDRRLGRKKIGM